MNISSFEWFEFDTYDEIVISNYCLSERDLFMCLWLSSDVQGVGVVVDELLSLTAESDNNINWGGNSYNVIFSKDKVRVTHLRKNKSFSYLKDEFIDILNRWKIEVC